MKKLMLNKEIIANLSLKEMNVVKGLTGETCGYAYTCALSCAPCATVYPCLSVDFCEATKEVSVCDLCQ